MKVTRQNKTTERAEQNGWKNDLKVVGTGFAMGTANVIPGVSGGTMAFILGIFEQLIGSIKQIASVETFRMVCRLQFRKMYETLPWRFLLALAVGVVLAMATTAKLCIYLLEFHREATFAAFFGLVLASVFSVFREVTCWSLSRWIFLAIGALTAYLIVTLVPVETPNVWWVTFLCGIIVICAMILPGISGSFLLLVLGQYNYVWGAVANLAGLKFAWADIKTIFWLAAGCAIGLGSFVYLLNYLFKKFHDLTIVTLIGFMIGSLWRLWPWQQVMEAAVKTAEGKVLLALPAQQAQLDALLTAGGKMEPTVVGNILPASFQAALWPVVFAVLGFALVFGLDYIAARKAKE